MTAPGNATTDPRVRASAYVPHNLAAPIRGASNGPLAGLTGVVKDAFDIAGERTGAGSPEWLESAEPASATAAAVRRVVDAGASIVAKTVCDELLYSITGSNVHYGTPLNPRAPDRLPGGSSSGSASAAAAGACDFALGTDTGGSVRAPAALCGVFGIRTSHGRVSTAGVVAMAPSFDSVGWLAGSAGVLRLVGRALLGGEATPSEVERVVVVQDLMDAADDAVGGAARSFLARAGLAQAEEVIIAEGAIGDWVETFRVIQGFEAWRSFGGWVSAHSPHLGPGVAERVRYASTVTEAEADTARATRASVTAHLETLLGVGTVAVLPTLPCPAPRLDADATELDHFRGRAMAFTCSAGLAGRPQVSLPIGLVDGAPVAISLLGWVGGDEDLLDMAARLAVHCAA
jgi:amidase